MRCLFAQNEFPGGEKRSCFTCFKIRVISEKFYFHIFPEVPDRIPIELHIGTFRIAEIRAKHCFLNKKITRVYSHGSFSKKSNFCSLQNLIRFKNDFMFPDCHPFPVLIQQVQLSPAGVFRRRGSNTIFWFRKLSS